MGYSDLTGPGSAAEGSALEPLRSVTPLQQFGREDPEPQPRQESGSVEIRRLFFALLRRKFLILAIVLIGVAVAAALTLRITPVYRATATLEVQARDMQVLQVAGSDSASGTDVDFMGTQVALLKSRALAERVAENLKLPDEPTYANPKAVPAARLNQAASKIIGGLSTNPIRGARVIEVSFASTSRGETARIANAVAANFIEMNLDRRFDATAYARKFLEDRIASTKILLERTERRLVEYSAEKELLDLTSVGGSEIGTSLDASALVSLSGTLTEAQNQRILSELRYREAVGNLSTRDMLESDAVQTLRATRSKLLSDYQTKLTDLRPEHPQMVELKARITGVEQEIEAERVNIIRTLQAEFSSAVARENALAQRVEQLKAQVQGLRSRSIEYNILHREADTLRAQYDALLNRLKEVSITSGIGTSQVSVLDAAQVPSAPFKPNIPSALLRAAALSLVLAIAIALFIEFLDDRIKSPDDVTGKLGMRVVGVIPKVKSGQALLRLLRNPRASITESFSSTRAALQFAITSGSLKSILVTGSRPSEGKTTTTLALASSFAATGKKVLIIDADLRRPSFAFDGEASAGLSGILLQGLPFVEQVVVGPTPNLYLLPSGAIPANPAELLSSSALLQLMEEAGSHFDLIFLDSPPVLTFADAPILASICDGTILVIQSGGVFSEGARRAIERLQLARATFLGAVLTKFNPRHAGYDYTYGYGYSAKDTRKMVKAASDKRRIRLFTETESGKR